MTERSLADKAGVTVLLLFSAAVVFAQQPQLPPDYPAGQYDESKVPKYSLPDPLVMLNGKKVKDTKTWNAKRRPEILKLFETNVYGRTMVGRPREMTWQVTSIDRNALDGAAITKNVTIYFAGKTDGRKIDLQITLPARAVKPARA